VLEFDPATGQRAAELRPSGVGRYVGAGFMSFWLVGWLAGELFAVGALLTLASAWLGRPVALGWLPSIETGSWMAPVALFLLFWLALWTLGGTAAVRELMRLIAGRDRISVDSGVLELRNHAGWLVTRLRIAREDLKTITIRRRDGALVAETAREAIVLTSLGTRDERLRLLDELRSALNLGDADAETAALPDAWEVETDVDGTPLLRRSRKLRRQQALVSWIATAVFGVALTGSIAGAVAPGSNGLAPWIAPFLLAPLASACLALALWLSKGSETYRLRQGAIEHRLRFGDRTRTRAYEPALLMLTRQVDSDGDEWFRLELAGPNGKRTIASTVHDHRPLLRLGRWIAQRTEVRFELPHELRVTERAA
jgi:hypothetical protein